MLRRPFQSRPPCILRVGRLASTYSRNPTSRQNAVRALANSLVLHGLTGGTKSSKDGLEQRTIQVIDPQTKQEVTIDLQTVQPFTPEFALLPLQYRTLVERRNLLETLRIRQKTVYDAEEVEPAGKDEMEPDNELVKKYVSEFIKRRRYTSDKSPSDRKISRYIEAAKQKALKEQRNRTSSRMVEDTPDDTLSFEEQWRRRQIYGENILKPMTPGSIARYNPNRDLKSPVKPRNVTIEQLLAAGSHIGHNKSSCHPAMKPFISGLHDTTHIINLDYTLAHLRRACTVVREVAFRHGVVLIIGTRKGHKPILTNATERMGAYMLFRKWIPGTLTNGKHVLFRGYVKEDQTPFRQYAKGVTKEDLLNLPPELESRPLMHKFIWDVGTNSWQRLGKEGSVQSYSTTTAADKQGKSSIVQKHVDLAEWMAWEKFASIVQDVADLSSDIVNLPRQSLHATLGINTEYIPDHGDNWYERQLQSETQELKQRELTSNETGDRNPIEMHQMDKFLAQKKYGGRIRGQYLSRRMKRLKSGFAQYPRVKVFRDRSTMVGQNRFDKDGSPFIQYPDGSYMVDHKLYDREGKRYDGERDCLVFSDGSELKFIGEGEGRKLIVVIGDKSFDVTSTVTGSAQKREILRRANDLYDTLANSKTFDTSTPVPPESLEGMAVLAQVFGAPTEAVKLGTNKEDEDDNASFKAREEDAKDLEEGEDMKGSEMLEIWDEHEAQTLDQVAQRSSRMTDAQEELAEAQDVPRLPETPFDNLFNRSTSTVRPDLIIVLNPRENRLALREAANHQVPTIGIIDTDTDPRSVTYSIPANDDSLRSVEYIMGVLSRAGEEGQIHRNIYTAQLDSLLQRAKQLLSESWEDYKQLSGDVDIRDPRVRVVREKYLKWYKLNQHSTDLNTLQKIAGQHIILAQDEIKRLRTDTTGWSMQDFLDHLKTSTRFPGIPDAVLEEMAQIQLKKSREAWAESREKVKLRDINYASESINGRVHIRT